MNKLVIFQKISGTCYSIKLIHIIHDLREQDAMFVTCLPFYQANRDFAI